MKQLSLIFVTFFIVLVQCNSMVLANSAPAAPVLTVTVSGIHVDLNVTAVANADGYTVYYAPENLSQISNIDLGSLTSFSVDLWDGASFYLAVKAYNGGGSSDFSNIELIKIDSGKYQLGTVKAFAQGLNIDLISGAADQCYESSSIDMTIISDIYQCILACGSDPSCMLGCDSNDSVMTESFAYITMTLTNSTPADITITLEGGTAFVPASSGTQTMIISKDIVITIPAMSTITECLPVFCIDPELASPGDSDIFQISGIADKTCLQEIIAKVKGKTVTDSVKLQDTIWNCVDPSSSVTPEEWDWLNSLL
jgi:hypothetical protein